MLTNLTESISPIYPVKSKQLFKGDAGNPFLAPRGVFICNNKLIVSDTGQNRVFIWNETPHEEYQPPDVVLGQEFSSGTGRNNGNKVTASSLQYPSGIWSDGHRLIVADAWNHRVLIWHSFPTQHGQSADVVVGQPGFETNEPNVIGLGKPPSSQSLYWCYGVWVHEEKLFVADTGNRRILVYHAIPTQNYVRADGVIGAPNFIEKDYDPHSAIWPYSIKVSERGEVAITDTQYFRVLYWPSVAAALSASAEMVFGQPDLQSNGQNQYLLRPAPNTLNWCYDSMFYKNGIWIADTGNSRLVWHSHISKEANPPAHRLIGHDDFLTGSENMETVRTTENSLYWPFAISIDENRMAVADTGNHRIILYELL
jgi:sugar lactone lactonase YvrE